MTARQAKRFPIEASLEIRLPDSPTPHHQALSENISMRGVYVAGDFPFKIGERIEVTLTMPEEVAGKPVRDWRCHGRVIHCATGTQGKPGAGVEFLYYEILRKPAPSMPHDRRLSFTLPV